MNKPLPRPTLHPSIAHLTQCGATHRAAALKELLLVQNSVTDQCLIPKSREKVIHRLTGIPLTIPPYIQDTPIPI